MDTVPPPAITAAATAAAAAPKSIFHSRTAIVGVVTALAGAAGTIWPDANAMIAAHSAAILLAAGILQLVLRLATHGRVVLFGDGGAEAAAPSTPPAPPPQAS